MLIRALNVFLHAIGACVPGHSEAELDYRLGQAEIDHQKAS
jgi:hypothetical protein